MLATPRLASLLRRAVSVSSIVRLEFYLAIEGFDVLFPVAESNLWRRALQNGLFRGDKAGGVEIGQYLLANRLEILHIGFTGVGKHSDKGRERIYRK